MVREGAGVTAEKSDSKTCFLPTSGSVRAAAGQVLRLFPLPSLQDCFSGVAFGTREQVALLGWGDRTEGPASGGRQPGDAAEGAQLLAWAWDLLGRADLWGGQKSAAQRRHGPGPARSLLL